MQSPDVESAKVGYCAQFAHVGCGGNPVAWVNGKLCCTKCDYKQDCAGNETLGAALENAAWKELNASEVIRKVVTTQPSLFG